MNIAINTRPAAQSFMIVSTQFGYPIYAANVAGRNDVEITDLPHEAAKFELALNDGPRMADAMTKRYGYTFAVVPVAH